MRNNLTQERLKEVLHYDPETGVFTVKVRMNNNAPGVGEVAGCLNPRGYRLIGVDGTQYRAHRLAWLYTEGVMPTRGMDHIDGNPDNNARANLRLAVQAQNLQNLCVPKHNTSGAVGVSWSERTQRWEVQIQVNYRCVHLGRYSDFTEAMEVRRQAKAKYHPFQPVQRGETPCSI